MEESPHHIVCGVFCHNLIDQVINLSSDSLGSSASSTLKRLWTEKLHFPTHSILPSPSDTHTDTHNPSPHRIFHTRLLEECEPYQHPCSHFGRPNLVMKRPTIDFNHTGARLEYIITQKKSLPAMVSTQIPIEQPIISNLRPKTTHWIVATYCSVPFRGCCTFVREIFCHESGELVEGPYCGVYRVIQISNAPVVSDAVVSLGSAISPLSVYALPLSNSEPFQSSLNRKRKHVSNSYLVTLRNSEGTELYDVVWPISFVPFCAEACDETTLSLRFIRESYPNPLLPDVSFVVSPPLASYPSLSEFDIQRILHRYRVQYSFDDFSDIEVHKDSICPDQSSMNVIHHLDASDLLSDNDFQEADRLASMLSMNFDDDGVENDLTSASNSLDQMLSELSQKLTHFETNNGEDQINDPGESSHTHEIGPSAKKARLQEHPFQKMQVYRSLAEQIYFGELEAEDYFQSITCQRLEPDHIILNYPETRSHHPLDPADELIADIIQPPNTIIGRCEKDLRLQEEMKMRIVDVSLKIDELDLVAKDCHLVLRLPDTFDSRDIRSRRQPFG